MFARFWIAEEPSGQLVACSEREPRPQRFSITFLHWNISFVNKLVLILEKVGRSVGTALSRFHKEDLPARVSSKLSF
jgi:hypothetical protein